jgi:hypothetical protein
MGETELHKTLKLVGWGILIKKGCSPVGMEISLPSYEHRSFEPVSEHNIADAVGIGRHEELAKKDAWNHTTTIKTVYVMEAKASYSDFKNGYCKHGWGKMWIIAPPDMIPTSELSPGVGLYEYDTDAKSLNLKVKSYYNGFVPSDFSLKQMREAIMWSGYGYSVHHRIEDSDALKQLYRAKKIEDFLEVGESVDILESEQDEKLKELECE